MRFIDLVRSRESCRNYTDHPVSREYLETIADAARLAPSACNNQPWRFYITERPEDSLATAKCLQGMGMNRFTDNVPSFIVITEPMIHLKETIASGLSGRQFSQVDIGIAAAHIILCARTLGVDSCIIGWFSDKKLHQALNLPVSEKVRLVIALGYGADVEPRPKRRMEFNEVVKFINDDMQKDV